MTLMPPESNLHVAAPRDAAPLNDRLVEAARYALLRRLAPALRHDIAGALQPLGMMTAVLDKRLQQAVPDQAALQKCSNAIGKLLREASSVCMELPGWLTPKADDKVSASRGVNDSIRLVSTNLMLRGFTIDVPVQTESAAAMPDEVSASALRQVFTICLVALTDAARAPACVFVRLEQTGSETSISIQLESTSGEEPGGADTSYRLLDWEDVLALADAEGVSVRRLVDGAELKFQG